MRELLGIAKQGDNVNVVQRGWWSLCYSFFKQDENGKPYYETLAEVPFTARVNMQSVASPAGAMPVVLGNGWPGVLLHEAVGHGLEGDFNRRGINIYGRIGQRVAAKI